MKTFLNIAVLFLLTISVIGCTSSQADEPAVDDPEMVNFVINVYAGEPQPNGSRADFGQGVIFAPADYSTERMHSLRVIIVRPDGTVEHNEHLRRTFPADGLSQYSGTRLRVVGGETKAVFLFANEASIIPAGSTEPFDFNTITIGSEFPFETIEGMILAADADGVLIDNTAPNGKRLIPMSERFDIDIPSPAETGQDVDLSADLFLTRAAVKFSFDINASFTPQTAFAIKQLAVSSIADREYLLPTSTEYTPAKYPSSFSDRYIINYAVPADAVPSTYHFPLPDGLFSFGTDYQPGTSFIYAPQLYFPETQIASGEKYTLLLSLDDSATGPYDVEIPFPNLPTLPRNTHVKVNITLGPTDVKCTVDILPYTAVPLNPEFGFDDLIQRPPVIGPMPPWITIPQPES